MFTAGYRPAPARVAYRPTETRAAASAPAPRHTTVATRARNAGSEISTNPYKSVVIISPPAHNAATPIRKHPFEGIVVSDRWNGFSHRDSNQRQVCWSHLQRDFRRHADGLGEQKTFGAHGLELTRQVFAAWRLFQHTHHNLDRLKTEIAPIQSELRQLLEEASPKGRRTRWHRRFANNLLKVWPALWTFVTVEGVEPTNNPAERALRGPVIHRKLSLGTQSENGERFAERALSAAATCRLQRRSLFTYLSELIIAHTRGDPFPALT